MEKINGKLKVTYKETGEDPRAVDLFRTMKMYEIVKWEIINS